MKHPFQVGGRYRNRHGEYVVISLDGPKMVLRYLNGGVLESPVELQARIWQNIQVEESMKSRVQKPGSISHRRRRGGQRGLECQGLRDHDFQKGVAGTSWRARRSLGGLLAQRMSDTTRYFFQSYAIYRRAEVHIAQPAHYDTESKRRQAKFIFELDSEGARYGFYIEKNEGPMDDTWDWPKFLAALEGEPNLREGIESAMRQLGLRWKVYIGADGGLIAQVKPLPTGLMWEWDDRDESEEIQWPAFTQRLRDIETEKWCDLHLCTSVVKDQAIAAGIQLVDTVTEVYRALLPLYEASTQRISPGSGGR